MHRRLWCDRVYSGGNLPLGFQYPTSLHLTIKARWNVPGERENAWTHGVSADHWERERERASERERFFVPLGLYPGRFYLFIFKERGREREREGEKHPCVVASHTPMTRDLASNLGMSLDWEANWQRFGSQAGTQSTEKHQPGQTYIVVIFRYYTSLSVYLGSWLCSKIQSWCSIIIAIPFLHVERNILCEKGKEWPVKFI